MNCVVHISKLVSKIYCKKVLKISLSLVVETGIFYSAADGGGIFSLLDCPLLSLFGLGGLYRLANWGCLYAV